MIQRSADLPWLQASFESLIDRFSQGRLPHALLLEGRSGIGEHEFADLLAQRLVCSEAGGRFDPCGHCKQCELVGAGFHPDIRTYRPEDSRYIKVDQVRSLGEFAVASPQVAKRKVIIVDSADQLNINAANALLKTLEEPNADVTLVMLLEAGKPLLPTLRSRCQSLNLPTPELEVATEWLLQALARQRDESDGDAAKKPDNINADGKGATKKSADKRTAEDKSAKGESPIDIHVVSKALQLAGGAPMAAKSYIQSDFVSATDACLDAFRQFLKSKVALEVASRAFLAIGLESSLGVMERWACDMARLSAGAPANNENAADVLGFLATNNHPLAAHGLVEKIREARSGLTYNVNPELEVERLLLAWLDLMPKRRRGKVA